MEEPIISLKKPFGNAEIWRYIDFTKFVDMIDRSSLFFARAARLGDGFEGSITSFQRYLLQHPAKTNKDDKKPQAPSTVFKTRSEYREFLTKCTIINCWHLNECESAAMWKQYVKGNEGIAIKSTYDRLTNCFIDKDFGIMIGRVEYIDYERDFGSFNNNTELFLYKRKSFEHERELRAIVQAFYCNRNGSVNYEKSRFEDGAYVKVDLNELVDRIYVAPTSPKWFYKLVKSVMKKYKLEKDISQSSLDENPLF